MKEFLDEIPFISADSSIRVLVFFRPNLILEAQSLVTEDTSVPLLIRVSVLVFDNAPSLRPPFECICYSINQGMNPSSALTCSSSV